MSQQMTPILIAQTLFQKELFSFSSQTIRDWFKLDKFQASNLLRRMEKDGLVARIEQGKFLLLGLTPEKVLSNPLFIGSHLVTPAYISFWSTLHYHGLTEQVPRTVFIATTRRKKELTFRGMHFKFVTLKPEAFFGYQREALAELPVVVADPAKAILDSLTLPQYAGGITEISKALQFAVMDNLVDIPALIEYAARLDYGSLSSRLGYLLDALGKEPQGLNISRGPVKLDPQNPARGTFDKRWQVYVNVKQDDLFPQGVS